MIAFLMYERRLDIAVAFIAVVVCPLRLECAECKCSPQMVYPYWCDEGGCPVKMTSVPQLRPGGYSECVTVHVCLKKDDFRKSPHLEIHSPIQDVIRPTLKKNRTTRKWGKERKRYEIRVGCNVSSQLLPPSNISLDLWELVYNCDNAKVGSKVSVTYRTISRSCNVSYTVKGVGRVSQTRYGFKSPALGRLAPVPTFNLSVDLPTKSLNVTVEPGEAVYARWCYKSNADCMGEDGSTQVTIDPSGSPSALVNITYLLPCVCVQVYYKYTDSARKIKCPFEDQSLADATDVWRSSEVVLYETSLIWKSKCPARGLNISAALCWKLHEHLCTPSSRSELTEAGGGQHLTYSTSAVDKHPQMCIKFSLRGSHNISCPFKSDMSSWEVNIMLDRHSVVLYLTSVVPATFSAQLCVPDERGCTPLGEIHSVTMIKNASDTRLNVPAHFLEVKPCAQVWQSVPPLHGRRILCLDYAHRRYILYFAAAFVLMAVASLLGSCIYHQAKNGAAGWPYIQKPVLLVCSSEQSAHVTATCALASMLQGELSATVHMALWSLTSQTKEGTQTGVADLGPLPWLYGQWEAVRDAQGKVLIVWSPEAKKSYEKWRREKMDRDKNERAKEEYSKAERTPKMKVEVKKYKELNETSVGTCEEGKAAEQRKDVKLFYNKDGTPEVENSSVIAPVFLAAMTRLEGVVQRGKGQGVALVYFQGLCHSRDVPKSLRSLPRYCLPQDFRGLIQELGGTRQQTKADKYRWHCWPRLLSKVLSIWLARQLARRLERLLPQTEGKNVPRCASSPRLMSERTRNRLKLLPTANRTAQGTVQEHEPLHGSPGRAEHV